MVGVGDDVAVEVKKHHLRLAFACEGGSGGDMRSKILKKTTSGLLLHAREVVATTRAPRAGRVHVGFKTEHELDQAGGPELANAY